MNFQDQSDGSFEELDELHALLRQPLWSGVKCRVLTMVENDGLRFPIDAIVIGSQDPKAPTVVFTGGVHGLERIGSQVVIQFLKSMLSFLQWDRSYRDLAESIRIVFIPILNPVGFFKHTRSNGSGVDLMRNAPLDAVDRSTFLVGGHRISPRLPWYRGRSLQPESKALIDFVREMTFASKFVISLDCHSGFGYVDRVWFPYAGSRRPFPHLDLAYGFKRRLDQGLPSHVYQVEPQSLSYICHGDLWDYLYGEYTKSNPTGAYLPLTLEMGSWMWVRKNPLQIFKKLGIFNPILPHRRKRIYRRHLAFFDFILRLARSNDSALSAERGTNLDTAWDARVSIGG